MSYSILVKYHDSPPSHLRCSAPSLREERGKTDLSGLGVSKKNETINYVY